MFGRLHLPSSVVVAAMISQVSSPYRAGNVREHASSCLHILLKAITATGNLTLKMNTLQGVARIPVPTDSMVPVGLLLRDGDIANVRAVWDTYALQDHDSSSTYECMCY